MRNRFLEILSALKRETIFVWFVIYTFSLMSGNKKMNAFELFFLSGIISIVFVSFIILIIQIFDNKKKKLHIRYTWTIIEFQL